MFLEDAHDIIKNKVNGFVCDGFYECQCGNIDPKVESINYSYSSKNGKTTGYVKLNCRDCGSIYNAEL